MKDQTKSNDVNNICEESRLPFNQCHCLECDPLFFDLSSSFIGARNIEELQESLLIAMEYITYLRNSDFELSPLQDDLSFRITDRTFVGGCYWAKCRGCNYPMLVDQGKDAEELFCESCLRKMLSRVEGHPRYYDDLFTYIAFILDSGKIPDSGEKQLPITKEFCDVNGFDFDIVQARLHATGGFDSREVLVNSMWNIAWFDRLPIRKDLASGI
jgi:hypothetical protein